MFKILVGACLIATTICTGAIAYETVYGGYYTWATIEGSYPLAQDLDYWTCMQYSADSSTYCYEQ